MKCALCNSRVSTKQGQLAFESKIVGKVIVPNIQYEECKSCKDRNIQIEEYDKIADIIEEKEKYHINQLPIGEFISAQEAADFLGMTKQAFSKSSRIKRGFIISTMIDNRRYYLKKSVLIFFSNKRDGRYLINKPKAKEEWHTLNEDRDISKAIQHLFPPTAYHKKEDISHLWHSNFSAKPQLGANYYIEEKTLTVDHGELYGTKN